MNITTIKNNKFFEIDYKKDTLQKFMNIIIIMKRVKFFYNFF